MARENHTLPHADRSCGQYVVRLALPRIVPRRSRAKIGTVATPTAIITCTSPAPSIATIRLRAGGSE